MMSYSGNKILVAGFGLLVSGYRGAKIYLTRRVMKSDSIAKSFLQNRNNYIYKNKHTMICAAISITLLTMIAAMHLLAKSKKEELGSMFKWISFFILAAATTVLVCQSICAVHMCCSNRCGYGME